MLTPNVQLSLWRNRLARSAVNRKVGGSSPPRDVFLIFFPLAHHVHCESYFHGLGLMAD